ncbi:hypothetical protein [Flavobacterium piscisymbiosum]|uniref:Uncharacterized protein n=1 Tax=Flavobacterium piscisymbiosum TaxID=2893753 RepID=A0ABS8MLL4_9FLAO|nr:hypothetical protein [Flavobacterium sp. F-30]MCC9066383.1 hypothetical protein [Flavobacterium sp. F-30]
MEAVNVTAASVSLFLKIITNSSNEDDEGLKKLKEFVTWLEVFSAVGSVISEFKLRKDAKNLVTYYNENRWPIEFTSDTRGIKARESLE